MGKEKKKGKKKGKGIIDGLPPANMNPVQLLEHLRRIRQELETERQERNTFQQEHDQMASLLQITKDKLEIQEVENRNMTFELEKQQMRHNTELKIMKQKIKHLMFENQKRIEESANENSLAMKAVQDDTKSGLTELMNELKNLRIKAKNDQNAHEQSIKNLKLKHADDLAKEKLSCEQRLLDLENKYKLKINSRDAENDLKFRNELHEVEERKNFEIFSLMQTHDRLYKDMKNYYNDITLNGINLINGLKQECESLRKKDELLERKVTEIMSENKQLNEKLEEQNRILRDNTTKLKRLNHVKVALKDKDHRLSIQDNTIRRQEKEIEVITELLENLKVERNELYEKFIAAIQEVSQRLMMKNNLLEIKMENIERELESKCIQLHETIKNFNLDVNSVEILTKSIDEMIHTKNNTIKDLQYELARACKAHNDLMKTYESRLQAFKIPTGETGFYPIKTPAIDDVTLGEGPAGLVSKCT